MWYIYHLDFDLISDILVVNNFKFMCSYGFILSIRSLCDRILQCEFRQFCNFAYLHCSSTYLNYPLSSSDNALECLLLCSIHTNIMKFILLKQYLRTVHILWKTNNQLFIVWRLVNIVSIHVDRASASLCSQYHVQVFLQLATSRVWRCKM